MQQRPIHESRHARFSVCSVLLVTAGGICFVVAGLSWIALCQEGTFDRCRNGQPSLELIGQFFLAAAGWSTSFVARYFVNRRKYASAGTALALTTVLLAAWVVLLDAATHGWDDLRLPSLLAALTTVGTLIALAAWSLRDTREDSQQSQRP